METTEQRENVRGSKRKIKSELGETAVPKKALRMNENTGVYKILILPKTHSEEVKKVTALSVQFADPVMEIDPEDERYYNAIKQEIGAESFDETAKILCQCRRDWYRLKVSTRAFLINRMLTNNHVTSMCCHAKHRLEPCLCKNKPDRLCCLNNPAECENCHNPDAIFDYMSANLENDSSM